MIKINLLNKIENTIKEKKDITFPLFQKQILSQHRVKRHLQRLGVKVLRLIDIDKNEPHSQYENECIPICKLLVKDPNTKLVVSPLSNKRYIEGENGEIYITIETHQLTIVNHQYSYNIDIQGKTYDRIKNIFDIEVDNRCKNYEKEIFFNIQNSLKEILNKFNK